MPGMFSKCFKFSVTIIPFPSEAVNKLSSLITFTLTLNYFTLTD